MLKQIYLINILCMKVGLKVNILIIMKKGQEDIVITLFWWNLNFKDFHIISYIMIAHLTTL